MQIINDAATKLLDLFDRLNGRFFNGELPKPSIYITPTNREYTKFGHDAIVVYNRSITQRHELNISSNILSHPIENICAAILHEMCHMYNYLNGIKDTSRGDTYHNRRFKRTAESHGLAVHRIDPYGYSRTTANTDLLLWCKNTIPKNWINVFRYKDSEEDGPYPNTDISHSGAGSSRIHNYRYECPECGAIARSGRPLALICGKCKCQMCQ